MGSSVIENFSITIYRFDVSEHCDSGEHVVVLSSIQLWIANLVGIFWIVLPLCPLSSQLWSWEKSSVLWWTVRRPEFTFGDGKLWSISGWKFSSSCSMILFSSVSTKHYSSSPSSILWSSFVSIIWVSSWIFSIGFIRSYGYSKKTEFTLVPWQAILALGRALFNVSVIFKSFFRETFLWLF